MARIHIKLISVFILYAIFAISIYKMRWLFCRFEERILQTIARTTDLILYLLVNFEVANQNFSQLPLLFNAFQLLSTSSFYLERNLLGLGREKVFQHYHFSLYMKQHFFSNSITLIFPLWEII